MPLVTTSQSSPKGGFYRFGPYEADLSKVELRKFGLRLHVERKPWQLLLYLVQRSGELVGRSELQSRLWPEGTHVDFELGLNVAIKKLRDALCDSAVESKYIETVSGYGYRFVANVEWLPSEPELIPPVRLSPNSSTIRPALPAELGRWWKRVRFFSPIALACIAFVAWMIANPLTRKTPQKAPRAKKLMIVVLPFENLSADPSQDYLSDGITEELSARIGNLDPQQLGVIGRTSAMTYKHAKKTISQIGQELSVGYVLEGSVRREGSRVRVTAQLVEVSDQAHIWAQNYDRDVHDLLQVEHEIGSDIAREVGISIAAEQPAKAFYAHIPPADAHEDYLLARYYFNQRTPAGWSAAEQHFRNAIRKDPLYGAAYSGLAETTGMPEALAAANKAVELDPTSGEGYTALGWVKFYQELDVKGAGDALKTAVQLDPNYAPARHTYSAFLQVSGRSEDAIREEQEAVALDPLFNIARVSLAALLWHAGESHRAMEQFNTVLKMAPQFPKAHETLGNIYLERGMCKKALQEFALSEHYGGSKQTDLLGYAYARCGNTKAALTMLSDLEAQDQSSSSGSLSFDLALVEIGLGNRDAAVEWLEKAYRQHDDEGLLSLKVDPIFSPLRSDPRFQQIVHGMDLP